MQQWNLRPETWKLNMFWVSSDCSHCVCINTMMTACFSQESSGMDANTISASSLNIDRVKTIKNSSKVAKIRTGNINGKQTHKI